MNPVVFMPRSASTLAPRTDALYFALVGVSLAIVALVFVLIVIFSCALSPRIAARRAERCRRSSSTRSRSAGRRDLVRLPAVLLVGGLDRRSRQLPPPRSAMEIHVVAKQWMWKVQHPNGLREINMLHVPVGEPVRLVMTSQDVIHSFAVPDFRIKQDILPGR